MHSIAKDEEMPAATDMMDVDDSQVDTVADMDSTSEGTAGNTENAGTHNQQAPNDLNRGADEDQTTHSKSNQETTTDNDDPKDHQNETTFNEPHKEEDSSDGEVTQVCKVDPKEWRQLHDEWLHVAMRASMGDPSLTSIPNLDNVKRRERKPPATILHLQPVRPVIKRYDLQLVVAGGDDQITLFHQAFLKWYQKVREADGSIILYPWAAVDRNEDPSPLIENSTDIPNSLPLLRKFVHKLFLRTSGGDYHMQVLMGSQEEIATIMQTIGWWLKSTSQGMWLTDLQSAKDSICVGWLLFLAGDYDCDALTQEIWIFTGVQVAVRFHAIDDGKK